MKTSSKPRLVALGRVSKVTRATFPGMTREQGIEVLFWP